MSDAAVQAPDDLEACFKVVEARCGAEGVSIALLGGAPKNYLAVQLRGATRLWDLEVSCAWPRFTSLPFVRLRDNHELLAHVLAQGAVCVDDHQGLSMDLDARDEVVAYTVLRAFRLLEESALDAAGGRSEFFNEFEAYWGTLPDAFQARSAVEALGSRRLVVHRSGCGEDTRWFFVERDQAAPSEFRMKDAEALRGAIFELPEPFLPPLPGEKVTTVFVQQLLDSLDAEQLAVWKDLSGPSMNGRREIALLLSVPRRDGSRTNIGLAFHITKGRPDASMPFHPLTISRHTARYMRERGGASDSLGRKHIVVFGCGSVGSEIADALASAGVSELTLVDADIMSVDNVFRHMLGRHYIGFTKVWGCQFELDYKYPGLKVNIAESSAEKWIETASLKGVHGIVMAVGVPTLERELAHRLRAASAAIPLLVTWQEALDLGGHSVVVSTSGAGCLDCLYRNDEGEPGLSPQTAFLVPGQKVSRNLTGCGSVFVPYGALQSRRTALMAAEHLLDALDGGPMPSYRFWTGQAKQAQAQGLATTNWWSASRATSPEEATRMIFAEPCPKCRPSGSST